VDYGLRARLLEAIEGMSAAQAMERMDEGLPKLWVVHHALRLRSEHPEWFGAEAGYTPVLAKGPQAKRVVAYLRGADVLTLVPRWTHAAEPWGDTAIDLPPGRWINRLTRAELQGGSLCVADLLAEFPVALIMRQGPQSKVTSVKAEGDADA
jgi:(1->4)-alpha-D-glucan 1-alpha-D-glucosylmutase